MSIGSDWIVLDTNVWIFGLRQQQDRPHCFELLRQLPRLQVYIPRQVLLELHANLSDDEVSGLFRLLRQYPERIRLQWEKAPEQLVQKYLSQGCKLGDAVVAAHIDGLNVGTLVSENRDFLVEVKGLPFRVADASTALDELQAAL